ncbi:MAG: LysM peptidoglycan-binding domain-containing protein [Pseudohongiellaceae bacterium]
MQISTSSYSTHWRRPLSVLCLCAAMIGCRTVGTEVAGDGTDTVTNTVTSPVTSEEANPAPERPANLALSVNSHRVRAPDNIVIETTPADAGYTNVWERLAANLTLYQNYSHPMIEEERLTYRGNQLYFDQIGTQAAPFLYWIAGEVESRDLPLELVLLPIVESAFDPTAASGEYAVGLWQFMEATARSFGLERDWWYDGRRDPVASTRAALDYLQALYVQFDEDWLLALAAYNTGEGNVRRAIRRNAREGKPVDFWNLALAGETRRHVPRLLALSSIVADPASYEVELPPIANEPYFEAVSLEHQLDLSVAAQLAGLELDALKALNPGFLQWSTPPDGSYALLLPNQSVSRFTDELGRLPASGRVTWNQYEIKPGDTLSSIARGLGTSVDVLRQVNGIRGSTIIAGRSLMLPRAPGSSLTVADFSSMPSVSNTANTVSTNVPARYTVKRGDSFWSIARRHDLRSADIVAWNGLSLDAILQPGQVLLLRAPTYLADADTGDSPGVVHYRIRPGDSLNRISKQFGITVADIASWNQIDPGALIYPGEILTLQIAVTRDIN